MNKSILIIHFLSPCHDTVCRSIKDFRQQKKGLVPRFRATLQDQTLQFCQSDCFNHRLVCDSWILPALYLNISLTFSISCFLPCYFCWLAAPAVGNALMRLDMQLCVVPADELASLRSVISLKQLAIFCILNWALNCGLEVRNKSKIHKPLQGHFLNSRYGSWTMHKECLN